MLSDNFSRNLCELRRQSGLSQEEFSEKLNVSRQAVSKWERGEAYPDIENLLAISKLFEVSLDTLMTGEVENPKTVLEAEQKFNESLKDDEDDEDEDEDDDGSGLWFGIAAILATVAYLLLGFLTDRGWAVGWTLFLLIPVLGSIGDCIRTKKISDFLYPVLVTFIYLFLGMHNGIWHPTWIIFITVPLFSIPANLIDKKRNKE